MRGIKRSNGREAKKLVFKAKSIAYENMYNLPKTKEEDNDMF